MSKCQKNYFVLKSNQSKFYKKYVKVKVSQKLLNSTFQQQKNYLKESSCTGAAAATGTPPNLWAWSPNSSNFMDLSVISSIFQWYPQYLVSISQWSLNIWVIPPQFVFFYETQFWISTICAKPTVPLIKSNQTIRFDKLTNRAFSHFHFHFFQVFRCKTERNSLQKLK